MTITGIRRLTRALNESAAARRELTTAIKRLTAALPEIREAAPATPPAPAPEGGPR